MARYVKQINGRHYLLKEDWRLQLGAASGTNKNGIPEPEEHEEEENKHSRMETQGENNLWIKWKKKVEQSD